MARQHSDAVDRSYQHRYLTDPHRNVDRQEIVYPDGPAAFESPEGPYYDDAPLETLKGVKKQAGVRYVPLRTALGPEHFRFPQWDAPDEDARMEKEWLQTVGVEPLAEDEELDTSWPDMPDRGRTDSALPDALDAFFAETDFLPDDRIALIEHVMRTVAAECPDADRVEDLCVGDAIVAAVDWFSTTTGFAR